MITILVIILSIIAVAMIALAFFVFKKKQVDPEQNQIFLMLQNQISDLRQVIDSKLSESSALTKTQLGESAKIVREVTAQLTKIDETNRQVVNFADQLQDLQDILKNPKQRGVLGEYYLETVLKNVLPPKSYQMQYALGEDENGRKTIVDAVVFVKEKIIPIDSKFSLENYSRLLAERNPLEREKIEKEFKKDLKTRIDETSKYIQPKKGTMDFAFMFIPSEAIFYDLLINQVGAVKVNTQDLIEYAFKEKHVIIVSPTSFLAYLQTVLQGLRALQIEESVQEIIKKIEDLNRHILSCDEFMQKLGANLDTTINAYNATYKEFKKVDKDLVRVGMDAGKVEPLTLAKTNKE